MTETQTFPIQWMKMFESARFLMGFARKPDHVGSECFSIQPDNGGGFYWTYIGTPNKPGVPVKMQIKMRIGFKSVRDAKYAAEAFWEENHERLAQDLLGATP